VRPDVCPSTTPMPVMATRESLTRRA